MNHIQQNINCYLVNYTLELVTTFKTLSKSTIACLWSLQITITLTEGALLIFFAIWVEKLLAWAAGY